MFSYRVDDEISLALPRVIDAQAVFELIKKNEAYLAEWLPWPRQLDSVAAEADIFREQLRLFADGRSLNLLIWFHGEIVGCLSLNTIHAETQSADIGYWLAQDKQGYGIMHRSLLALFEISFGEYGLEKLMIAAATGNQPSNAVIRHAGFHFDGVNRRAEKLERGWVDHNWYSLLKSEWLELATAVHDESRKN